jgi:hypothetical protein
MGLHSRSSFGLASLSSLLSPSDSDLLRSILISGTTTVTSGPSLTGTVSTQSGNTISAASGIYFEDYFFNSTCSAQGGLCLDSHAGHSHEPMGYHYHVTIDSTGAATFPYISGPKYYGCRSTCCASRTSNTCSGTSTCGTADGTTSYGCSTSTTTSAPTKTPTSSSTTSPTLRPTSSHRSSSSNKNENTDIALGVGIGGGVLILAAVGFWCMWGSTSKSQPDDMELAKRG